MNRVHKLLLAAAGGALALAIACGGETVVERVVETVIVEKQVTVPGERVVETVIVEKAGETIVQKVVETVIVETEKVVTVEKEVAKVVEVEKEVKVAPTDSRYGGTLVYMLGAAISTLDVHRTTGTTANTPMFNVQEFLFGFDEDLIAQPLLVDTWEVSSDGFTQSYKLREGVKFHNGTPLTAEHAVKSWLRWAERDNFGNTIMGFIDEVKATGELTFEITMVEPTALVQEGLARIGGYYPVIIPPVMYNVPVATGADVMVGTGPYKVEEWLPGDKLITVRYDDYLPNDLPSSFMSGHKTAYFDVVNYVIVPDVNAQVSALKTGQIDILGQIASDFVDDLSRDPNLKVQIITNNSTRYGAWIDNVDGVFEDVRIRQAFQMAYPVEDVLTAALGDERFWTVCPSMMLCGTKWGGFADASGGVYNVRDAGGLERARELVKEAGLEGAEVIVLSPEDMPRFAAGALISKQTLEDIGFKVDFKPTDWATQTNWREQPELWDVFHTAGGGSWGANPLLNSSLAKNGYWNKYQDESGKMSEGMYDLARANSPKDQLEIVKGMQNVFWNDIPYISFGDAFNAVALRADIAGSKTQFAMPFNAYNAWRIK